MVASRAATVDAAYATVPPTWVGETAVILASGPTLCAEDVDACRGRTRVIAVKDAVRLAPWADVLYGCGNDFSNWWPINGPGLRSFAGRRYTLDPKAAPWADVLRNTGTTGLETDPTGLRTGGNSSYQALNLAFHYGVRRILLLGLHMHQSPHGPKYFYGDRPIVSVSPFHQMLPAFDTIAAALAAAGVTVINCSRETSLKAFPRVPLSEALG